MHLMLLFVTLARAAELPFCTQDLSDHPLPFSSGRHIEPDHLRERALRPGLMRLREDLCRCLPRWPRNRPALVKAHLHVDPNGGEMRVEYIVKPPWSRPVRQMVKCMGEPTLVGRLGMGPAQAWSAVSAGDADCVCLCVCVCGGGGAEERSWALVTLACQAPG